MLTTESVEVVLYAIATGFADRAKHLLSTTEELDDDERERLNKVVWDDATDPATQAERLGRELAALGADRALVNECYRLAFYLGGGSTKLATTNPLYAAFLANRSGRLLDKWVHYFAIYHRHLERFRGRAPKVLEIGVYHGGSLDLWAGYFGEGTTIVGLDIDETALRLAGPGHVVVIGDQADPDALQALIDRHGPFDIVIDDGGHRMEQQIASIEALFPAVAEGGVYLVEDCHTSYWDEYGGGSGREGTFVEWVKARIDDLHGYHRAEGPAAGPWTTEVDGIHCYDSVVVLDKQQRPAPFSEQVGGSDFVYGGRPTSVLVGEMLATRDAAIAERDAAVAALAAARRASEDEDRLARGELTELRPLVAELEERLRSTELQLDVTRNDLLEAWEQVQGLRATLSWRITAPIRSVRRRMGRGG